MNLTFLTLTIPFGFMWFMLAGIANSGCDNISQGVFLDACNEQKNWMVPTFLIVGFLVIDIGVYSFMMYGRKDDEPKLSDEKSPAPYSIDEGKNLKADIPDMVKHFLDLKSGDKLEWRMDSDGKNSVCVVSRKAKDRRIE